MSATAGGGERPPGLHVCLVGMDGIGKTSMSRLLRERLEGMGVPVHRLSWREEMAGHRRTGTRTALQELWVESFRLMYLGASDAGALPPSYERFAEEGWEGRLAASQAEANVPAGPLAAAWLEWAGQVLLHHEVVRPARAEGTWVVEDSPNLRMMYKEITLARALAGGTPVEAEVDQALGVLLDLFRTCAPDVGIVLSGPAERAYRWRMAQRDRLGAVEDMGAAAGARGWAGFEQLQSECDTFFRRLAADWGWLVVEVEERPAEENFTTLWERLRAHPAAAAALSHYEHEVIP